MAIRSAAKSKEVFDPFGGDFDNAHQSNRSAWLPSGFRGKIELTECKWVISGKSGAKMWINEFQILSTNKPDEVPVGESRSHVITFGAPGTHKNRYAVGDTKAFVAEATQTPIEEVTQEDCNGVAAADQMLAGTIMLLATTGEKFTQHAYTLVELAPALRGDAPRA